MPLGAPVALVMVVSVCVFCVVVCRCDHNLHYTHDGHNGQYVCVMFVCFISIEEAREK